MKTKELLIKPRTILNRTIEVTQERINTSVERDSAHCMISDAVKDSVPTAERVESDLQCIKWSDKSTGYRYVYLTPPSAQHAIIHFDQGEKDKIKPFKFCLKCPSLFPLSTLNEEQKEKKRQYNRELKARMILGKANGQGREEVIAVLGGDIPPRVPGGHSRIFGLKQMVA